MIDQARENSISVSMVSMPKLLQCVVEEVCDKILPRGSGVGKEITILIDFADTFEKLLFCDSTRIQQVTNI